MSFVPVALLWLTACMSEPGTAEFPGDVDHYDPIAGLPAVTAFAGAGAQLKEVELRYVRPDGTMDFDVEGYHPQAEYSFRVPTSEAPDAPPGTPGHDRSDGVEVSLAKPTWRYVQSRGGGCNYEGNFWFGGMEQRATSVRNDLPTITPTCSLAKLFQRAHQEGVAKDAVGSITIDEDGYELTITDGGITRIMMGFDCKRAETDDERRDRERQERDADRERDRAPDAAPDRDRDRRGGRPDRGKGKGRKHR